MSSARRTEHHQPLLPQHFHHISQQQQPQVLPPQQQPYQPAPINASEDAPEIFVDPAMGTPLPIYVERDVPNYEHIVGLIKQHGGFISSNYSTVPYMLVDRQKESGQSLYRQYHNKKGKVVLDAQWALACVQAGEMLTFKKNWAGFKVTGTEIVVSAPEPATERGPPEVQMTAPNPNTNIVPPAAAPSQTNSRSKKKGRTSATNTAATNTTENLPPVPPSETRPSAQLTPQPSQTQTQVRPQSNQFGFTTPLPPGATNSNAPFPGWGQVVQQHAQHQHQQQSGSQHQQQALAPPLHLSQLHHRPPAMPANPFSGAGTAASTAAAAAVVAAAASRGHWYGVSAPPPPPADSTVQNSPRVSAGGSQQQQQQQRSQGVFPPHFDPAWATSGTDDVYYQPFPAFQPPAYVVPGPVPAATQGATDASDDAGEDEAALPEGAVDETRGRKRKRGAENGKKSKYVAPPATNPSSLVPALAPPRRSPTPPARVVKSTYGGNLFTAEDIAYLKSYIDWCVDMGLVLSLREICERLAIKAPHHTFYSWRRYCNKHKIKLGSYQMVGAGEPSSSHVEEEEDENGDSDGEEGAVAAALLAGDKPPIDPRRSPTPPKSLHRSTTGKGIAFTDEDVTYLVRYMTYRKHKESNLNMPQFWNDLAAKAPHHSRASWLKYWRRHRHEIEVDGDDQDPSNAAGGSSSLQVPTHVPPTAKRQRYSHDDDILLAKFWATEPQGTSDKLFQDFAKVHPHHPWKGWQEHHRIHKTQIDHLVRLHSNGVDLHTLPVPPPTKTGRPPAPKATKD